MNSYVFKMDFGGGLIYCDGLVYCLRVEMKAPTNETFVSINELLTKHKIYKDMLYKALGAGANVQERELGALCLILC